MHSGSARVVRTAYSVYALMEWSLVFLDVGWDTTSILDFSNISFVVLDHQPAPVRFVQDGQQRGRGVFAQRDN